ncbi:winged helix-turn-helix transcriptional regulator, partial [Micromonospora sagamiensis]|uniref:winged helix-turn-helix transcriptional regulator n=1 Tax=Micromonospora sagamiensis TaxID=47875 RepID=UPI001C944876
LSRHDDPSHRQKIDYRLTEAAIELVPLMAHLGAWGSRWLPTTPELSIRAQLLARGGPEMWERFMDELRARTSKAVRNLPTASSPNSPWPTNAPLPQPSASSRNLERVIRAADLGVDREPCSARLARPGTNWVSEASWLPEV